MSNPIKEARAEVATVLETVAGLAVHQFVPEQMDAPAAVITYQDPYLVPGKALGENAVGLRVRLYVYGDNQTSTESLDALIVNVSKALRQEFGHGPVSVGVDGQTYGPNAYLTADFTINLINFKDGIN